MAASLDFDQIPSSEPIAGPEGRATFWFQALWQRLTAHLAKSAYGTGAYASTSGAVAIPHGLGVAPAIGSCSVQLIGSSSVVCTLVSVDETSINARLWVSNTGAAVANGSHNLAWRAARP